MLVSSFVVKTPLVLNGNGRSEPCLSELVPGNLKIRGNFSGKKQVFCQELWQVTNMSCEAAHALAARTTKPARSRLCHAANDGASTVI
jgi:hypothetical protein